LQTPTAVLTGCFLLNRRQGLQPLSGWLNFHQATIILKNEIPVIKNRTETNFQSGLTNEEQLVSYLIITKD
jgi:hypothetical protein